MKLHLKSLQGNAVLPNAEMCATTYIQANHVGTMCFDHLFEVLSSQSMGDPSLEVASDGHYGLVELYATIIFRLVETVVAAEMVRLVIAGGIYSVDHQANQRFRLLEQGIRPREEHSSE